MAFSSASATAIMCLTLKPTFSETHRAQVWASPALALEREAIKKREVMAVTDLKPLPHSICTLQAPHPPAPGPQGADSLHACGQRQNQGSEREGGQRGPERAERTLLDQVSDWQGKERTAARGPVTGLPE